MDDIAGADGPVAPTLDPVATHDTRGTDGPSAAHATAPAGGPDVAGHPIGTDGPVVGTAGDTAQAASGGAPGLAALGLAPGDRVRWHDRQSTRWREGRVVARERDGSVGVRDARGASRALRVERLEVRDRGPRGGVVWEPLPDRAARTEQLGLWGGEPRPPAPR